MKILAIVSGMVIGLAAVIVTTGCEQRAEAAPSGGRLNQMHSRVCTIQFRRDALGAARDLPVSPMTGGINGATVAISGKLRSLDEAWLAVETEKDGLIFIPKEYCWSRCSSLRTAACSTRELSYRDCCQSKTVSASRSFHDLPERILGVVRPQYWRMR
jgi:hypothetical protein